MSIRTKLSHFFTRGAETIEPERSDVRVVAPSERPETVSSEVAPEAGPPPESEHVSPDAEELASEHRRS